MESNWTKAIKLLETGQYTCVLCKGQTICTSTKRGVRPLLEWLDKKTDLNGFSAADKVVGKATAFLYVLLGVEEVYAPVMSRPAIDVLEKYHIQVQYDIAVEQIRNRAGTGRCPMEEAVEEITEAAEAVNAIRQKMEILKTQELK